MVSNDEEIDNLKRKRDLIERKIEKMILKNLNEFKSKKKYLETELNDLEKKIENEFEELYREY